VLPDAPEDQDDGRPQVTLSHLGTGTSGPPLKEFSVCQRKLGQHVPHVESPRPDLMGYHTPDKKGAK
jgi:hypothetical protein